MRYISENQHKLHILRDWMLVALVIVLAVLIWMLIWYGDELKKEVELTNHVVELWGEALTEVDLYRSAGFILLHSPAMVKTKEKK